MGIGGTWGNRGEIVLSDPGSSIVRPQVRPPRGGSTGGTLAAGRFRHAVPVAWRASAKRECDTVDGRDRHVLSVMDDASRLPSFEARFRMYMQAI